MLEEVEESDEQVREDENKNNKKIYPFIFTTKEDTLE